MKYIAKYEDKITRQEKWVVCLVKTTLDIFINTSFIAYFKEKYILILNRLDRWVPKEFLNKRTEKEVWVP